MADSIIYIKDSKTGLDYPIKLKDNSDSTYTINDDFVLFLELLCEE